MTVPARWLFVVASLSLAAAVLSTLVVAVDIAGGRRQRMWIMNVVWPLTALWSGPLGLYAYFTVGRAPAAGGRREVPAREKAFWQQVAVGATHCGSGCTLGDLLAEALVTIVPVTLLGSHVAGTWAIDLGLAFLLGIAFQYFTIAPMRHLGVRDGLAAALKADTASLLAWQLGMYGWMALSLFVWFSSETLPKGGPTFWFMMQLAMVAGFLTSYPVNWWLLRTGLKEPM
ncbi:MAG: DUF4396 domain-containing protein [Vicinamibacterales bacterium]